MNERTTEHHAGRRTAALALPVATAMVLVASLAAGAATAWWPSARTGADVQQPDTKLAVVADLTDDGLDDILWYAADDWGGDTGEELWVAKPQGGFTTQSVAQVSGQYRPVVGDFTGDGGDDVLWLSYEGRPSSVWRFAGGRVVRNTSYRLPAHWSFVEVVPNATGTDDVVFAGSQMDGGQILWDTDDLSLGNPALTIYPGRGRGEPVTGDFDGDGRGDVLLYAPGADGDVIWWGRADGKVDRAPIGNISGSYTPVALDADGDGRDDIAFHGPPLDQVVPLWRGRAGRWFTKTNEPPIGSFGYAVLQRSHEAGGRDTVLLYSETGATKAWSVGADGRAQLQVTERLATWPTMGHFSDGIRDDALLNGYRGADRLLLSPQVAS